MYTTNLRKVGGSIMLAVPPAILDVLHLQSGSTVGIAIESGKLMIEPQPRPKYSLDELLAQCDGNIELTEEDHEWLNIKPVGAELI
jgi:antitoxin ChpS